MKLRTKTWLPATIGLAAFSMGGAALAQCNSGCTPPPPACCSPPPAPPSPPEPPSGCCRPPPAPDYPGGGFGGGNFNLNVNINGNSNSNLNSNENLIRARGAGGGGGDVYVSGGGGAYFNVDQPYPTVIQGMNVESAAMAQVVQVPIQMSRWMASRVVIQAVCIDDRNIPHPASQVQPGRDVAEDYEGEIYRCIAGSRLQVTYADYLNELVNFDRGQTMLCGKGESLWYRRSRGGHGAAQAAAYTAEQYSTMYSEAYSEMYAQQGGMSGPVTVRTEGGGGQIAGGGMAVGGGEMICAAQKPERDCNERSLLRRYGAGIKVLTLWREEFYTEYQEQIVQSAAAVSVSSSLTLDGGVGGRVF